MLVIIVGCGRMGRHVAETLGERGKDVVVIDHSSDAFRELSDTFTGFTRHGDAVEIETLKTAGTARADALIACTGNDDVNLLVAKIADSIFNVPKITIRAVDPMKKQFFEQMGFTTVCPILLGAEASIEFLG